MARRICKPKVEILSSTPEGVDGCVTCPVASCPQAGRISGKKGESWVLQIFHQGRGPTKSSNRKQRRENDAKRLGEMLTRETREGCPYP